MKKRKVLFMCIYNSARSVMAETILNPLCGEEFEAQSVGIHDGIKAHVEREFCAVHCS